VLTMDHLAANLTAIERTLGARPRLPDDEGRARLEAVAGVPVLSVQSAGGSWVTLNSRRDPLAEASRAVQSAVSGRMSPSVVVALGLGLGFVIDAIEQALPDAKIVALEPEPACVRSMLGRRDFTRLISADRLLLLWGPDYVGAVQGWRFVDGPDESRLTVTHPALSREAADGIAAAAKVLERMVFGARANAEARRKFAGRYLLNTLKNLPAIARSADVSELFGRFAGVPGIVVSAGPSLDENIADLREVADRALIISTDTALRPLLSAGIHPPFAVAVDPSELNARHLTSLPRMGATHLVAEGSVEPSALSEFGGRLFTFKVSDHHPWPWLRRSGLDRATLRAWGSVATTAFDLAVTMGCTPIVFVGQDLAFSGNRPYCRGTTNEDSWGERVGRGEVLEDIWRDSVNANSCMEPGLDGLSIRTTGTLLAFRNWLVEQAELLEPGRVINASGAGILVGRNIRQASLKQVLPSIDAARDVQGGSNKVNLGLGDQRRRAPSAIPIVPRGDESTLVEEWHQWAAGAVDKESLHAALDAAARIPTARAADAYIAEGPVANWCMLPPERARRIRALLAGTAVVGSQAAGTRNAPHDGREVLARILGRDRLVNATAPPKTPDSDPFVPACYRFAWSPSVAREVIAFEELLAGEVSITDRSAPNPEFGAWLGQDVESADVLKHSAVQSDHPRAVTASADETARRALATEWLALEAAAAEKRSTLARGRLRLAAAAHRAMNLEPSGGDPREVQLDFGLPSGVTFRVRPWSVMRQATGLLAVARAGSGRKPDHRLHAADPRARVLTAATHAIEPVVLTQRGLPRCHIARPLGERAVVVTPTHTLTSFRVNEAGEFEVAHTWPVPVTGEIAFGGEGGALAWSNPGRYVLLRSSAGSQVVIEDVPFRPLRVALTAAEEPLWCGFDGGVWSWLPGSGGRLLIDTPAPIAIHTLPNGVRLDPAYRREDGYPRRVLARSGWFWEFGASEWLDVDLEPAGQCTSTARTRDWSAAAHPYADVIDLSADDGTALELGCYYPLTVAWAGDSLLATTGDGDVLLFAGLARILSDLSRDMKEPAR
jgi:hypothetical protein